MILFLKTWKWPEKGFFLSDNITKGNKSNSIWNNQKRVSFSAWCHSVIGTTVSRLVLIVLIYHWSFTDIVWRAIHSIVHIVWMLKTFLVHALHWKKWAAKWDPGGLYPIVRKETPYFLPQQQCPTWCLTADSMAFGKIDIIIYILFLLSDIAVTPDGPFDELMCQSCIKLYSFFHTLLQTINVQNICEQIMISWLLLSFCFYFLELCSLTRKCNKKKKKV